MNKFILEKEFKKISSTGPRYGAGDVGYTSYLFNINTQKQPYEVVVSLEKI